MKRILSLYFAALSLLLTSCFKDTGNYEYSELNPPKWVVGEMGRYTAYAGEIAHIDGSKLFTWTKDSLKRASEVRYEWELNGRIIAEDIRFKMPTEEIMKRANIQEYTLTKAHQGIFRIIEKSTGVSFPIRFLINLYPYYANYDYFFFLDNNGSADVASLTRRWTRDGKLKFTLLKEAYSFHNDGKKMEGKPLEMTWSYAKHIGVAGAFTVLTDKNHYILEGTSLKDEGKLNDQFLDGTPPNFKPVHRADIDVLGDDGRPTTLIATEDGLVYTRIMGPNYLGGKFLTEPYEVDKKGYKITMFGSSRFCANFLCLDELNNRILFASQFASRLNLTPGSQEQTSVYKTRITPLRDTPTFKLSGLGDNIEVVAIRGRHHFGDFSSWIAGRMGAIYTIFYNKKDDPDNTYTHDVVVDNESLMTKDASLASGFEKNVRIPRIERGEPLLTTTSLRSERTAKEACQRVFFIYNGKLTYYEQEANYMIPGMKGAWNFAYPEGQPKPESKITALIYEYFDCSELLIGCENGDYFLYNIQEIRKPRLLAHGNAGGKILSIRESGLRTVSHDR